MGVNALIFKINLFYNTASTERVRNDSQALQVIVFYNIGEGCRYLITKRGVKSLLLEFVIDFASLVFHCVGSAIYVYQSGIGYFADLRLLRLTPFPWNPRQCATRKPYFVRHLLLFLSIVSCKPDNAHKQQKPLKRVAFLLRIALKYL